MSDTIEALSEKVRGRVITSSDPDYDDARAVYNAMHDRRPRAVVRCVDSADAMAVIAAARDSGVDLAVRGGGHSVSGFGTVDDGLVIDLSPMKSVRVDPAKKVASVGGGTTWGDVDHATYPFGLAAPGGVVSTTGVGGLTLGGGIGYLTRSLGLSIDDLLSADVVLADGSQVTACDYQNEDLIWALRGGGGNFGVVISFEFRLHEVGDVVGGPLFYDFDDATAVLECYRSYIKEAPEQLGCFFGWQIAPPLPFIPEERVGDLFCVLVTCWNGAYEKAEQVLRPLRDVAEVQAEQVVVMPFPALQSACGDFVPKGMQNYWKADFATELTDEAIAAHVEFGARTPNVHSSMHLHPINGAAQRVGTNETAFGHRDKSFAPVVVGIWPDPADNEANTKWVRDYYAAIHPHSGSEGGNINFMSGDDDHRAAGNYGANYERLAAVKAAYDPDNFFHLNQNIAPQKIGARDADVVAKDFHSRREASRNPAAPKMPLGEAVTKRGTTMPDKWEFRSETYDNCNCAVNCGCQFNLPSTHGYCQSAFVGSIVGGHFNATPLAGLKWAALYKWPGEIKDGNGKRQIVIDQRADEAQRSALDTIISGQACEPLSNFFSVFSSTCTEVCETRFLPISLEANLELRTAKVAIPGIMTSTGKPIVNEFTGEPFHIALARPSGSFEFTYAEIGQGTTAVTGEMEMSFQDSWAHFCVHHFNQDGMVRKRSRLTAWLGA